MQTILGKDYLSEKEVCAMLGFSISWLRKRRERHEAPPFVRFNPDGKIFFEKEKLEEWVKKTLIETE